MIDFFVVNSDGFITQTGYCTYDTDLPDTGGLHFGRCPEGATHFVDGEFLTIYDEQRSVQKALCIREDRLNTGPDRINPIWWAAMTPNEQQAWVNYRQALLDVPNQPGFPHEIHWPTKPA